MNGMGEMSSVLRIILIIGSLIFFVFIMNMVRTKKLELKYALTWILTSFSFVLLSIFPEILFFIAALMHIELPVNALYLCVISLLLLIVFTLSVAVSRQALRIKTLVQEIGLIKETLERMKKEG
ncbi:MAG TPA: DUF2304 domain-containing protein [Thermoclostridium caenicola]|uniref:DUF2304 domain-containing protein n=1 Tax=Thermoclostridium caenicola TaxID=659425 RepID=A0A1M6DLT2_9FIRM|nr:DUF2304 domain-containing protein [Thermoclostridium caenicola]SHI74277.1 hypothetical protein SAMN05444373_100828 [Thermoclostridium caenicola]HOK43239.1 DUF2304 domain-containing protein [Thermoclostridium caenicola]HOL84878.1 DUF2304 domain-containing protein [Thermoclostridium caenicola]HOP73385.1 DUF2304 domain-containing protein [Thermoclostridium caenicola]HPO77299.1 DUF2304 domain-containing protein [Thermoclostridium caenicola]